jgi:surfactin synthase thioesterase subunit
VFPGGHFYLNPQFENVMLTITRQLMEWTAVS